MYKNLRIQHRIQLLVVAAAVVLSILAGTAIYKMSVIGDELTDIAHRDIPITEALQLVTIHQLEQAILVEQIIGSMGAQDVTLESVVKKFDTLAQKVDAEILDAERLAAEAIGAANDQLHADEFKHVLQELKQIEVAHKEFDNHVLDLAGLARADAPRAEVLALVKKIHEEEVALNDGVKALLLEVAKFTEAASEKALADERRALVLISIVSAVGLTGMIALGVLVGTGIVRPLKSATEAFAALQAGDLTVSPAQSSFNDEIKTLNHALEEFRRSLQQQRKQDEEAKAVRRRREQAQEEIGQLVGIFGASIRGIFELVSTSSGNMSSQSGSMHTDASQTLRLSDELLNQSDLTSQSAQQVGAATEQMVASVKEIARQNVTSNEIAEQALAAADASSTQVRDLTDAAGKIGNVIEMITAIAQQTNLLALNATIEAARAGEAGKGFAVVASEVKALANQTAQATAEISQQVVGIQDASEEAAKNIQSIGDVIRRLHELSTTVTSAITEQEATTQEIASSVASVAGIAQEVSEQVRAVRERAESTEQLAGQLGSVADGLRSDASSLGGEMETFLTTIKTVGADAEAQTLTAVSVDIAAVVTLGGKTLRGSVTEISASHLLFSEVITDSPGTLTSVSMDGWPDALSARVASNEGGGTYLQLPLNDDHLARMRGYVERLSA